MTERPDVPEPAPGGSHDPHVVILTGLSGAGKTAAAKLFEDLGFTVVDNLPGELLPALAELVSDDRERFRAGRHRARRAGGRRAAGAGRDARRARGARHPAPGRLPRGPRRGRSSGASRRRATATRWPRAAGSPAR